MAEFARTKLLLSGFEGAPGVNIFNWMAPGHGAITLDLVEEWHDILFTSLTAFDDGLFATGVTLTIDENVGVHDVATGNLTGIFTDTSGPYTMTGVGAPNISRATQVGFRWQTADFRAGRRVQGRSFIGPCSADALQSDGGIVAAGIAGWPALFTGMFDGLAGRLIVWSRPTPANPVGDYADVTALTIAPRPFSLTGRRD